jgi:hypothetical protein
MAEYLEKLMAKTITKLKIASSDKPKPAKDKPADEDLIPDDIPPEDPTAFVDLFEGVGFRSTRR